MKKLIAGIVAALLLACQTSKQAGPEIISETQEELNAYVVRVNFCLFESEVAASPDVAVRFKNALDTWCEVLPIEAAVFMQRETLFEWDGISHQRGIIRVHIVDLNAPPYNRADGVLGFWSWTDNNLILDKDSLELDLDEAYAVILHELGHVFGLTHFVNPRDIFAITGVYVVPSDFDARKLIMYPEASPLNRHSKLSQLEIELAEKNLLSLQQVGRNDCLNLTAH